MFAGCAAPLEGATPGALASADATAAAAAGTGQPGASSPSPPQPAVGEACARDAVFKEHIYHPDRLFTVHPCLALTGTVTSIRHERDGDLHVRLRLEGSDNDYLIPGNLGVLVVEPTCVESVTQADALQPCAGAPRPPGVDLLTPGARVTVTGDLVEDSVHHWREIHPMLSAVLAG